MVLFAGDRGTRGQPRNAEPAPGTHPGCARPRRAARHPPAVPGVRLAGTLLALAALLAAPALAQPRPAADPGWRPVVLELYTAQGCASCPPADRMLAEMAQREDVIALALHVDYWDYIGWADVFADPAHSERQKRYARRQGLSTIYTPQVVINGAEFMEGFRVMAIMEAIEAWRVAPRPVSLSLQRVDGATLEIRGAPIAAEAEVPLASRAGAALAMPAPRAASGAGAGARSAAHEVQLVRYQPHARVAITEGENAGLTADYANIVTSWQTVATWDLRDPFEMSVRLEGEGAIVVLVQEPGQGEIVAAARLR